MIKDSRAYRYAKWCAQRSNRKVGKYVKLQANKWLKIADGKHKEAYISEKAYRKICKLPRHHIFRYCIFYLKVSSFKY